MAVTIRDVAKQAAVSVATVSRALNNSGAVSGEARARVERAAAELNYRPNNAARTLSTRRTRMLGVVLPDLYGEFFSELIRGLDREAQARGYHLLLSSSHDHAGEVETALHSLHALVDGMIVMAPALAPAVLQQLVPHDVPMMLLNSPLRLDTVGSIAIDNFGGAHAVVKHLASHGYRRIAHVRGPHGNHDAAERQRGYRAALAEASIALDPVLEVAADFTGDAGYRAAQQLMMLEDAPRAIFAANDAAAIGVMSALRDAGLDVPQQVAVAGFDNISSAQYSIPPLTTVEIALAELGALAVSQLIERVERRAASPGAEILGTRVVVRRSCGCNGSGYIDVMAKVFSPS